MPNKREFGLMALASVATLCVGMAFMRPAGIATVLGDGEVWAATYEIENNADQIDKQAERLAIAVQRVAMAHRHGRLELACELKQMPRAD